jgi:hypothetical protein
MSDNIVEIPSCVGANTTEEPIGERQLWTAVLLLAVEDWRQGSLKKRRQAQKFLFEDQDNFYRVCAGAGLEPESFRSRLMKIGRKIELSGPWQHQMAA